MSAESSSSHSSDLFRRALLAVVAAIASSLPATALAQDPALTLPGVSAARFQSGSVIRLPQRALATTLEVSFPAGDNGGRVDLHVGESRLATSAFAQNGESILTARTPEPAGFLRLDEQTVQMVRIATTTETLATWTILRWKTDTAYVESSRSTKEGRAPDVRINQPAGGAFVFRRRPSSVAVTGTILSAGPVIVTVAGQTVTPTQGPRESTFEAEIPLPADRNEVEVSVQNRASGAIRQIVLPVVSAR